MTRPAVRVELTISIPPEWICVDPSDVRAVREMAEMAGNVPISFMPEASQGSGTQIPSPGAGAILQAFSSLQAMGSIFSAWYCQPVETQTGPFLLIAGGVVTLHALPRSEGAPDGLTEIALRELAQNSGGADSADQLVQMVEIDGGVAVRITRERTRHASNDPSIVRDQHLVQYASVVPGTEILGVLSLFSPTVEMIDRLDPAFDSIASTWSMRTRSASPKDDMLPLG
jgi:hypothetical protein